MKNFPVTIKEDLIIDGENMNGKTFWISRSMAVAMFIFCKRNNQWYVLATKRGEGCPDYQGYWCCPCGYVDYGETIALARARELKEETGLRSIDIEWKGPYINDDPKENRQNVTFRFVGEFLLLNMYNLFTFNIAELPKLTSEYSEPNEIADLKWIPLGSIDNYQWAFNHHELIIEMFKKL